MRDIKFRAWDKFGETMITSDELLVANSPYLKHSLIDTKKLKLMQFTGLKDVNGVEIYEGDLIKKDDDKFVKAGVVSFIHGCWMVASKSGEQYFNLHWHLSQVEVIGNIHQHPELLEQKQ